jgi:hypothetical protein
MIKVRVMSRLADIIKDSVFIGATTIAMENKFWTLIAPYDVNKLCEIIDENKPLVLSPEILEWGKPTYKKFPDIFEKYTVEFMLALGEKKRPDLIPLIKTHPRGIEWLGNKINEIKSQLET